MEEVDLVLVATSTPDDIFGSACQVGASWVQAGRRQAALQGRWALQASSALQAPSCAAG